MNAEEQVDAEPERRGDEARLTTSRVITAGGATMPIETYSDGSVRVDGKIVRPYRSDEQRPS